MARTAQNSRRRALKVRSGDEVEVIAGKDRGKRGRVLRVEPKHERVYVEGMNIVKRHMRPQQVADTSRGQTVGGVIEREGPIHASNVMLVDPRDKRPTRIGVERDEKGARRRIARRSGTRID
jgi:large subunit ribosomal protein L24